VKIDTRQGCLFSPLFFVVQVNTLIQNCKPSGNNGVFINVNVDNAASLMLVDDLNQITGGTWKTGHPKLNQSGFPKILKML
jgi:hypothetical protein